MPGDTVLTSRPSAEMVPRITTMSGKASPRRACATSDNDARGVSPICALPESGKAPPPLPTGTAETHCVLPRRPTAEPHARKESDTSSDDRSLRQRLMLRTACRISNVQGRMWARSSTRSSDWRAYAGHPGGGDCQGPILSHGLSRPDPGLRRHPPPPPSRRLRPWAQHTPIAGDLATGMVPHHPSTA